MFYFVVCIIQYVICIGVLKSRRVVLPSIIVGSLVSFSQSA